ncbi:MAG: ribosome rescue protein RqcH [Candidatus Bathyarchaeota archaeon]|nr:fibronectin-binding domain-containing protein [Candidatus Bathyarchaeota archaeon A05DMB-3]MDH7606640.1 ribosome rescue protein RqcH [Candidatus Bathyarchaeota archaeon]
MQKEEFRSFDVAAVVRELKGTIVNSRVSNIYQLDGKTLLFKLRGLGENVFRLVLEAGKRLNLTSYALEKPLVPPAFCMALRKYLRNSWLTNVEQYMFERIVIFTFANKAGAFRLVLELFGEGNIILINSENKIVQALHYKRMRDRNILRGETFHFPPSSGQNPLEISKQAFSEGLKNFGDVEVVRALARFLGIGGIYAEEILLRLGLDKTTPCNTLNSSKIEDLYNCLQSLISQVLEGKLEPCIIFDEKGLFLDVAPLRLKLYEGLGHQFYKSFNEALDEFYMKTEFLEKAVEEKKGEEFEREIERLKRVLAEQEKVLKEAEEKAEKYRRIGDLIYMHSSELQELLDKFLEEKRLDKDWDAIIAQVLAGKQAGLKPNTLFESFDKQRLVLTVSVNGLHFGLDLRKDLFANAAKFYERAKAAKRKLEGAKKALEETRKRLLEAEAKLRKTEAVEQVTPAMIVKELAKRRIKQKKWFEKFRYFTSSDGFLVVAGKDAISNEVLIKKYTKPEDIVFHADIVGAPFVVVKTDGKMPSEQCLREAAELAAAYSRGWREGFTSVDVYWVKPNQLSKAGGSGEYVPPGAFVVSGSRNWMRGTPLKIAIGVLFDEETSEPSFIGGAVSAVKAETNAYVTIVPGDASGKELLRQILKVLATKTSKEKREKVLKTSIENIRDFVPYVKGRILAE